MQEQLSLDVETDRLVRTATWIGVVPAVVIGAVLCLVNVFVGIAAAIVLAVVWVLVIRARVAGASSKALASVTTTPLVPGSQPRLENVLEGLCMTGGVSDPTVHLVDSPAMNAMVVADAEHADLVLSTGLVDGLGRLELEGVVANLLGRVRDGSARYGTTVVGLLGSSQIAARRLAAGLGEQRSVHSDLAAVDMTRYPPGLISALARMGDVGTVVAGAEPSTAHLWIAPVVDGADRVPSEVAATAVQPLSLRIAVLEEL
ncbi:MAG: hypothetical protein M3Y51_04270 [Actinomycetota bacterium]|nr:hypothetical protein [Actinomycetota bacterium]